MLREFIGDLIGAVCVFATPIVLLFIAHAVG